jgi:hypothetical protein
MFCPIILPNYLLSAVIRPFINQKYIISTICTNADSGDSIDQSGEA